jgi:catechol 2,3-dioxygenase-like lactoylglutathione lyase family enzyme
MPVGTKNKLIAGCGTHHIAIHTHNLAESVKFYTEVMGMESVVEFVSGNGRKIALLDMGDGSHLELFEPSGTSPTATDNIVFHIALATTDIQNAVERVRAAGCKITVEPKDVTLGTINATIAFFIGVSGEVVEFFQVNNP